MKKRSPAAVLLLPLVTLGIYCIYWLYATRKELIAHKAEAKRIPPVGILLLPFLVIIALVGMIFAVHGIFEPNDTPAVVAIVPIIIIIASILGMIFLPLWWFWYYCKVVSQITKGMDFTQLYVLFVVITWLCGFFPVWMLIVQLEFNKLASKDNPTPHAPKAAHSSKG